MSKEQIVELVRKYLKGHQPTDNPIEVLEQSVRSDGDWWYVPVRPNHEIPKTYEYYVALAEVETELKQNEKIDVLLVPAA
jgi:hypothetical protein